MKTPLILSHVLRSRLSFPATEPQDPRRVSGGFLKQSLKGCRTCQPKTLQNAFKNPSKTVQEGVEIDDALGFAGLKKAVPGCGGPVAGNESLDLK